MKKNASEPVQRASVPNHRATAVSTQNEGAFHMGMGLSGFSIAAEAAGIAHDHQGIHTAGFLAT